ncbi:sporulation YhaL family protein [Jeotgalibacillus soli]|uniref:Uncharacterized protein n=1 Tax=Jeotgalibacillus soli TaxID=889306 RepID=A0A0C2R5R7_9BACL|nr:sporulation YhaL family protein [Jeotgalibacillus soli]KIL45595.1 hypothetical protein KP78_19440 [Jeotgalibacillus soli]
MWPLWIDFTIAGIVLSGIMALRSAYQEKKIERKFIEEHGSTYINRMYEEKKKRLNFRDED